METVEGYREPCISRFKPGKGTRIDEMKLKPNTCLLVGLNLKYNNGIIMTRSQRNKEPVEFVETNATGKRFDIPAGSILPKGLRVTDNKAMIRLEKTKREQKK